jgi:hypothetical protein
MKKTKKIKIKKLKLKLQKQGELGKTPQSKDNEKQQQNWVRKSNLQID